MMKMQQLAGRSPRGKSAFKYGDIVVTRYKFGGNGPWNYMVEEPPEGVTHVIHIGVFISETERHVITASDFAQIKKHADPVHQKHWSKDGTTTFEIIGRVEL